MIVLALAVLAITLLVSLALATSHPRHHDPCRARCEYSVDVGMWPEHRCAGPDGCLYARWGW